MRTDNIAYKLELELPEIIKEIAQEYNIHPYINNPDFLEKRNNMWHQFGLLTHTKMVRKAFLNDLNPLLSSWGLHSNVKEVLSEKIEGMPKNRLLEISIPLHDLGKIVCFKDKKENRNHELLSKKLLSEEFLENKLIYFGLSSNHIDYIRECIANHNLLAQQIREEIQQNDNFILDYIPKKELDCMCKNLAEKNQKIKVESGVFFLCDSLGKTDVRISKNRDDKVYESKIEQALKERGLPPYLKMAVMQLPVNIKLSEIYLRNIFE